MAELRWTPTNQEMVGTLKETIPGFRTGRLQLPWREVTVDVEIDFIPDGYVLEGDRLDLFEVEVTHHIPRSTMQKICQLWQVADNVGYEVNLFVVNRYGHINQLPLEIPYFGFIQEDLRENPPPEDSGFTPEDIAYIRAALTPSAPE